MHDSIDNLPGAFFLSFPEKKDFLISEVEERFPQYGKPAFYGDLIHYPKANISDDFSASIPYWCASAMIEPKKCEFASIGEAARLLKDIQRNWGSYQFTQFRRAALIQEKLPYINIKEKQFPFTMPTSPIGLYTLLDSNHMVFSEKTTSSLPAGLFRFVEDHVNPPSRAYLKVQEALVRFAGFFSDISDLALGAAYARDSADGCETRAAGAQAQRDDATIAAGSSRGAASIPGPACFPQTGQRCFDAGACPGGWTWVLRQLGCKVFAVDRAPLAEPLMKDPDVTFMTHDAFTLKPQELGFFDWVFSDVICYPERLYEWVLMWLESGMCRNMICTIKMQGATDWSLVQRFAAIPNSRVLHLCYNKHELTWLHAGTEAAGAKTAAETQGYTKETEK